MFTLEGSLGGQPLFLFLLTSLPTASQLMCGFCIFELFGLGLDMRESVLVVCFELEEPVTKSSETILKSTILSLLIRLEFNPFFL